MPICVEEAIQEALRDGRFDNLPGKGKPLELDPSPDAVINNLLRDSKMRPVWIEVGCEIDTLRERAALFRDEFARRHMSVFEELTQKRTAAKPEVWWRRWWRILWSGSDNRLRRGDPVASFNRRWDVELARQAALLHEANEKIRRFNRLVPLRQLQRNTVSVSEHMEEFVCRFTKLSYAADGSVVPLRGQVLPSLLQQRTKSDDNLSAPREVRQQELLNARH
jgi:hypothetical protein